MNEDILRYNEQLNEIDGLLTEKEQSFKKKIFSLAKMEALVFSDPYLTKIYDEMAENGEEKYGYHYNETIQNMIFNDYVLNSSKYLQKYKMAIPKKKKRRDKSGINKLRHDSTVDIKKTEPQPVAETTTAGSAGGAAGYVGYAGPAAWSKSGKPISKPLYIGGKVVGEGVVGEDHNYLTEASLFKYIAETLNEDIDLSMYDKLNKEYQQTHGGLGVKELPEDPEISREISDIDDRTPKYTGQDISRMPNTDKKILYNDSMDKNSYFPHPDNKNLQDDGISGTVKEDLQNFYQNLNPQDAINKAKVDYSGAMKQNNQGLADKITGNLRSHLDSSGYNWKQDPHALEMIGEKAVSKAQQKFMGMVHAVQTGELSPSKVGNTVKQAAKSMKAGDVEDFAATKHEDLPNRVDETISSEGIAKMNYRWINSIATNDKIRSLNDLDIVLYGMMNNKKITNPDVMKEIIKLGRNIFNNKTTQNLEEDYAISKLNPLKQIGWISMPQYRFGGAAVFSVDQNDEFGRKVGAAYIIGSPNDFEYELKQYGDNNYIVVNNPKFWQRYIKIDETTHKVYFVNDDEKWKYLGKYKDLEINPNKGTWGHNHDYQRFMSNIESLRKQGATFKFNDSDLNYSDMNEEDNVGGVNGGVEAYRNILSRMIKHINTMQELVDILVYFIKYNKITDQQQQKEVILLAKELFNEKNINSLDENEMSDSDFGEWIANGYKHQINIIVNNSKDINDLNSKIMSLAKNNKIKLDSDTFKFMVEIGNKLFNEKNSLQEVSMIDHNPTTMAMSDPINMATGGMEKASDMNTQFDIMSVDEMAAANDPKVQKLVDLVNGLIKLAVDPDGDPIGVVDSSGTWEEPYVYQPIVYSNGQLKITSYSQYKQQPETEVILKRNMEFDGIPTLKNIANMYRKAIRNNQKSQNNINMNTQNNFGEDINEMLSELEKLSEQHEKLVGMNEDRKPSALVLKDRLGNENEKNFKSDLQHSGTKEIIDVTKQLEYADQQTTVGDNPYKAAEDIEKKVSEKALENQGDSTADGKHIPKRNLTTDEANEVDDYRLGLGDYKFDNEVGEKYEERMKADMGDDFYEKRQRRLEVQANQPMYNKDQQPTETKKEDEEDNKFIQNLGESTVLTGRYLNEIGKSHMIDFNLNEVKVVTNESVNDNFFKINLNGLGNTYSNKLNESTKKLESNEKIGEIIDTYNFYLNEGSVYCVKNTGILNESHEAGVLNTSEIDKMKHLLGYKPSEFIKTSKIKI